MGAVRDPRVALEARRRRLDALLESRRLELVLKQLRKLHSEGSAPPTIRIRNVFVHTSNPAKVGSPESPVASRLRSPNGQALRLYLQAVFLAQCEMQPGTTGPPSTRPLIRAADDPRPAWADLVAPFVTEPPRGKRTKEGATTRDRVVRQLQSALDSLAEKDLVEIGKPRSQNRYDHPRFMSEGGRGVMAQPEYYAVPKAGFFEVPATFFLNGWPWAMTNSEIACWLMFRHLANQHPRSAAGDGNYVYGPEREAEYGLPRDTYEAHIMLRRFELLHRMPSAWFTDDGKIIGDVDKGEAYEPLRFKLTDAGLAEQDVLIHVLARLEG